ncbi:hypothetical protein Tco_0228796 [Tanacetum coccineum]
MLEDLLSYIEVLESAQDTDVGLGETGKLIQKLHQKGVYEESFQDMLHELRGSYAYYNGFRTSKDKEDPRWSTSIKTRRQRRHLQHWKRFERLYFIQLPPKDDDPYYDLEGGHSYSEALLNSDPSPPPNQGNYLPEIRKELKMCEAKLKDLPPHLEYAFLEDNKKLPVIIAKDLSVDEKTALIKVLKSRKQAIAWKLSDIKGRLEKTVPHGPIGLVNASNGHSEPHYKTPIGCTPYKLVYGKPCHLPIELEHRAYWALKHANFDLKTAGDHRKLQLNELNELRDQAYENSLIYKERTKKLHDSKIKNRIFNVGDQVLLFNSRLKIFSGKLKTRWSGPFTITEVFPYGTAKLSHSDGSNFKVNCHRLKHYFGGDTPTMVF